MHSIADLSDNLELDKVHFHFFCPSSHIKMMPHKLRVTSRNSPQITVWWRPIHHWLIWPKIAIIPFLVPSHIKMMHCTITHMIDSCYSTSFCRPLWLFSRNFIALYVKDLLKQLSLITFVSVSSLIQIQFNLPDNRVTLPLVHYEACCNQTNTETEEVLKNGIKGFQFPGTHQILRCHNSARWPLGHLSYSLLYELLLSHWHTFTGVLSSPVLSVLLHWYSCSLFITCFEQPRKDNKKS